MNKDNYPKYYIWACSIVYVAAFSIFPVYAVRELSKRGYFHNSELLIAFNENAVTYLAVVLGSWFFFGWFAVYLSRHIPCTSCGEPIVTSKKDSFKDLAIKPYINLIKVRQVCKQCQ